jgi:CheY-specific phosphatase CheX
MDATLIRRFIEATQNVFETMLGTSVKFGKPGPTGRVASDGDVSGIIGFSGDVAGAAVIRLPMRTAASPSGPTRRTSRTRSASWQT